MSFNKQDGAASESYYASKYPNFKVKAYEGSVKVLSAKPTKLWSISSKNC